MSASFAGLVQYSSSGNFFDGTGTSINNVNVPNNLNVGTSDAPNGASVVAIGAGHSFKSAGSVAGSVAVGKSLVVSGSYQLVVGGFNAQNDSTSPFIIGAGTDPGSGRADSFKVTASGSIILPTHAAASGQPSWTGTTGELVIAADAMYVFVGGSWRQLTF